MMSLQLTAQDNKISTNIQIAGFINNDAVLLRWVPENYIEWQKGIKNGYTLYKRVVMRDGKAIKKLDSTLLGIFFPFPIEQWKKHADSSHFAVAAEALYGKSFEVITQNSSFYNLINRSKEQDNRFSIGMLCADQSFSVACMMGLGFIDSNVKNNEAYLYKIVLNDRDTNRKKIDIGYTVVDFEFGNYLPRLFGITHKETENAVTIMVPYQPFKGIYNTFELQRSTDFKKFSTIKDNSYYSLATTPDDPQYNIYNDTLSNQTSTVYYRLRGRTPFDTYGPYSDTISVSIMPSLIGDPWITNLSEVGNSKLSIGWETPEYKKENLKGFMVYSSKSFNGPYINVLDSPIEPSNKLALVDVPNGFAYYKVGALDMFNRPYLSMPRLYQSVDSIPPSRPKALIGSFDTTGVVNLKWNKGKEKDLLGYQVLYSANIHSEFSLVSKNFIYDSTFSSAFPIDMLSSDIFFKVVALDTRYNMSNPSDPIKLIKPDKIPPSAPVIISESDSSRLVKINIAPSRSSDVINHYLFFTPESINPKKIEVFKGTINKDTTINLTNLTEKGIIYCVAEDITGRRNTSNSLVINQQIIDPIKPFKVIAKPLLDEGCVDLKWDKTNLSGSIMIYRKDGINSFNLISTVESQIGKFEDRNVTINTNYSYKLVGFNLKGKAISSVVAVKFK